MRKLFIAANIHLEFYNSNKPEFRKLLVNLLEIYDKILPPTRRSQLRNEHMLKGSICGEKNDQFRSILFQ